MTVNLGPSIHDVIFDLWGRVNALVGGIAPFQTEASEWDPIQTELREARW